MALRLLPVVEPNAPWFWRFVAWHATSGPAAVLRLLAIGCVLFLTGFDIPFWKYLLVAAAFTAAERASVMNHEAEQRPVCRPSMTASIIAIVVTISMVLFGGHFLLLAIAP